MGDLCSAMEQIAPLHAAADWDNVGLVAGAASWPVSRILLTIDLTAAVLDEACCGKCDAIVCYHPPIYKPVKSLVADRGSPAGLAAEALSCRIAVYSPHTALDAAPGGTNDALAALCGLMETEPLESVANLAAQSKLVVFVPERHVEEVAEAAFRVGGGVIGNYTQCSFRQAGHGTFFGSETTQPAVGQKGQFERVEEIRLELVFPTDRLREIVSAVRKAHPYEEPAYDIYSLQATPISDLGQGRVGRFPKAARLGDLAALLKGQTQAANVSIIGNARAVIRRGFVCAGAAGSLPLEARERPSHEDVVVTGEIRHHDALWYERCGSAAIVLGHWASERPVLAPLSARLKQALPGVEAIVSRRDRDPFSVV